MGLSNGCPPPQHAGERRIALVKRPRLSAAGHRFTAWDVARLKVGPDGRAERNERP